MLPPLRLAQFFGLSLFLGYLFFVYKPVYEHEKGHNTPRQSPQVVAGLETSYNVRCLKGEPLKPQEIKARLQTAYPDGSVDVTDLTGTEDHYSVYISSKKFDGLSRIQCHKQVMDVFGPELKTGEVHALTIKTEVIK